MKIIIESTIEKISSKVDGTVTIQISTQELDSASAGNLFALRGKFVKTLISDSNITTLEAETVDSTSLVGGKKNKSESQRLRNVLFLLHAQGSEMDFETFYRMEYNKIIEHYKTKLD